MAPQNTYENNVATWSRTAILTRLPREIERKKLVLQVNSDCAILGGIFSTVDDGSWIEGIMVHCTGTNNGIRWVKFIQTRKGELSG